MRAVLIKELYREPDKVISVAGYKTSSLGMVLSFPRRPVGYVVLQYITQGGHCMSSKGKHIGMLAPKLHNLFDFFLL
jgi:hypothetical protein